MVLSINKMIEECHQTAKDKGWWDKGERNFGELCTLFHAEISEAFEEFRKGKGINEIYFEGDSNKPEGIPIEIADLLIRIFDFCGYYEINMEHALALKALYNKKRAYRHGNKKA